MKKRCSTCRHDLETGKFGADKSRADGLRLRCKQCENQLAREYRLRLGHPRHRVQLAKWIPL